jgi:hypothetical protein
MPAHGCRKSTIVQFSYLAVSKTTVFERKKAWNALDSSVRLLACKCAILCAQQTIHDKTLR